ncbi:hypothetical protein D8674_016619 [Pyrus ussuriensis x Pyrus communis]|uniref:Uncharacterized protein n=1 Tax=Pyrus ussuriensis x Pyrus communis TaxID=2448454 RepID=A0A5N5HAB1_9ROSA|nr:hypothetical protein D8674_016619 [Pyrus ussuriensis x Pyrus communis]
MSGTIALMTDMGNRSSSVHGRRSLRVFDNMSQEALESSIICLKLGIFREFSRRVFTIWRESHSKMKSLKPLFHCQRQVFPSSQSFRLEGREHEAKSNDMGSHKRAPIITKNDAHTPRPAIFTPCAIYIDFQRAKGRFDPIHNWRDSRRMGTWSM